jgi:hypothetical protein
VETEFRRFTCWTEKSASEAGFFAVGTRDLINDGMVSAAKVDIPLTPFGSSEEISIDQMIDSFIASFDVDESNSVYAITGDSGSGKTFAIRCAQTRVERDSRAHVVYVHRDVTSLQGILRLILQALPGPAAEEALKEVERAKVQELDVLSLVKLVHTQLIVELDLGHGLGELIVDETLTDLERTALQALFGDLEGSRYVNGLSAYLDLQEIKNHLIREDGILWNHVKAMRGESGEDPLPMFDSSEIIKPTAAMKRSKTNEKLGNFFFFFESNPDLVSKIVNAVLERALGAQVKASRDLTEIVDDARKILSQQGKQLVLMFEDIAKNGVGLSDSVFDLFRAPNTSTTKPIRVIFAATTGHWPRIPPNVRSTSTRIEVKNLRVEDPEGHEIGLRIIAQYFNSARLGKKTIAEAWDKASEEERLGRNWIPNKCDDCQFKIECHSEFQSIGGIGLYPLNRIAASNVLRENQLQNEQEGHRGISPRLIVKKLVGEWLRNSTAALALNKFPTAQLQEVVGVRVSPTRLKSDVASDEESIPAEMLGRIGRARVGWANYDQTRETYSEKLALAFGLNFAERTGNVAPDPIEATPEKAPQAATIKWFSTDFGDVADWAYSDEKPAMADGRVDALRRILRDFVEVSLRLNRFLVDGSSPIVNDLILNYLREISVRIEGSKGDEDSPRMQKMVPRSKNSYLMIMAAFWYSNSKSWEGEYTSDGVRHKCEPLTLFKGRQLLMNWVTSFADEIAKKIHLIMSDSTASVLLARMRLLTLICNEKENFDTLITVAKLTSFASVINDFGVEKFDSLTLSLVDEFDYLIAASITAYQGDIGKKRLAEDIVCKLNVLESFEARPDWRSNIPLELSDQMPVMNEKIEIFSSHIRTLLETGETAVKQFSEDLHNLDLIQFKVQLREFRIVFESVVSRMQTTKNPEKVRELMDTLDIGLAELIEHRESIFSGITAEMSDPDIWSIDRQFPFLNGWTLAYRELMSVAVDLVEELDTRIGNQSLPDMGALRTELEQSLDMIQIPSGGKLNE